jgi:hypothetical protein
LSEGAGAGASGGGASVAGTAVRSRMGIGLDRLLPPCAALPFAPAPVGGVGAGDGKGVPGRATASPRCGTPVADVPAGAFTTVGGPRVTGTE